MALGERADRVALLTLAAAVVSAFVLALASGGPMGRMGAEDVPEIVTDLPLDASDPRPIVAVEVVVPEAVESPGVE